MKKDWADKKRKEGRVIASSQIFMVNIQQRKGKEQKKLTIKLPTKTPTAIKTIFMNNKIPFSCSLNLFKISERKIVDMPERSRVKISGRTSSIRKRAHLAYRLKMGLRNLA